MYSVNIFIIVNTNLAKIYMAITRDSVPLYSHTGHNRRETIWVEEVSWSSFIFSLNRKIFCDTKLLLIVHGFGYCSCVFGKSKIFFSVIFTINCMWVK